jgi:hypothetical protein
VKTTVIITEEHLVPCFDSEVDDISRFLSKVRQLRQGTGYGEIRVLMRDGFLVEWYFTEREHYKGRTACADA